jgi:conjugal transfer mating pair stabilization protein TraN
MRTLLFFSFLLITSLLRESSADPWQNLQQGDQTAQEFLNQIESKKKEAGGHPFYKGIPNEAKLSDKQLEGKSKNALQQNEAGQMVIESNDENPPFKIDPLKDPLLVGSQKIVNKPLIYIGGKGTRVNTTPAKTNDETLTCEEARDPYPDTCTSEVVVPIIKTTERKEWTGQFQYSKCSNMERKGHYLPCGSLRSAVAQASRALRGKKVSRRRQPIDIGTVMNITGPYKACMHELASHKGRSCSYCTASTPKLPFKEEQIKEVSLVKHPRNSQQLHFARSHFHMYSSGRFEYSDHPFIKITYEEESHKVLDDEEILHCENLEERASLGLCSYQSKACTQGKQTRLIQGIPITRNCWQYTLKYACEYPSKNDCGPLRARGCVQTHSACKHSVGNICVTQTQTYVCQGNTQPTYNITGGQTPFCLDGNCRDQSWETNDEMMNAAAQLSILKEMQGQIKNKPLTIFNGKDDRCSKYIAGFKDCCGAGKGWGKYVGSTCSTGEKELNKKREARLCQYVGSYCSKKAPITRTCIEKKYTYCCFSNKLLKAFHVQGRPQIKLGWGSPKEPLCRGFTIEELQRIDFSKLDLREAFEDIMQRFQTGKNKSNAPGMGKHIGERMETIKKGMVPPNQKQPLQRPEGA